MRVVVVGAGIAGLAAALEVRRLRPDADVTVLEAGTRVGGKVAVSQVGGMAVDEGADSMLTRVPDGLALVQAAGLTDEIVSPAAGSAFLWTGGVLRPLPGATLLGLPTDLTLLARSRVLSRRGLARVPLDLAVPGSGTHDDVSVGRIVRRRLGGEVVERLVDPLLGGVYAGRADELSLQATLPQLVGPLARTASLLRAARAARAATPPTDGPMFASLPGGLGRLPVALVQASGARLRLNSAVRALARTARGWQLTFGSAADPEQACADAVVLAVPGPAAGRLLADLVPGAAELLPDYASVAIVTLVLDGSVPGQGSGYLVPAVEGRATKAVTFSSRKWRHLAGARSVVRASVGRHGDTAVLQRDDDELSSLVRAELAAAVGPLPTLVEARVTRWGGGLPQYAVGHPGRVARLRSGVAGHPGLAVAGAAYDGVGVPACARSGREAARAALAGALPQNGVHDPDGPA